MTWPMEFPPQQCSACGDIYNVSYLTPVQCDERLVGWTCFECDGETEYVECAPDVGIAPTQLRLPEQSVADETIVKPVHVEGAYL